MFVLVWWKSTGERQHNKNGRQSINGNWNW
jgi:hypothetical protein